jgi:uncharacterized LabA/DUF88 family protein
VDRCALFVDASYVLADGALAVHGTRRRDSVSWDYAGLLQLLGNLAMERTRLPLLRCYWYEATVEGRRSADHDTLADLPGVKLRVAKMRPGRREGVEGEIHRDLTTLARNKAVSDVVVVSGEEDLAPVIADVQDMGMRVTLLQVATDGNWAPSRALRQECDDIVELNAAHLRPYVELISGAEPPRADEPDGAHALRTPVNGAVNGNGYHNGNGRAPAAHAAGYGQPQGRPEQPARAAAEYQQFSEPPAEQTARPATSPAAADAGQPDAGQQERADTAATDFPPAGDYAASLDYSASVDYGVPAAAEQGPAKEYGPNQEYGSAPDYGSGQEYGSPQEYGSAQDYPAPAAAVAASVPAAPREDLYAAPVAVPAAADEHHGEHERRPAAARVGADLSAYAPGAARGQHQRDGGFREHDLGDRLQPVPVAVPSGSAQIRRLPVRSAGPAGPGNSQPPLGLPAAPAGQPPMAQSALGQSPLAQSPLAQPGLNAPGQAEAGTGQQSGAQVSAGQPTGGQPVVPAAPVDPNGMGYPAARGAVYAGAAQGGPRQVFPGPGSPVGLGGPAGPGPQHPGQGFGPAAAGSQPPAPAPGGQQDLGAQSGPIGLVGPGGYSGGAAGASLADAVQSAHEEGQAFGDSVARDAPALWLEAVLARKPRMPSDLEARLLQGSTLPIDFLLHDEVRHALRRGFWDALERARR